MSSHPKTANANRLLWAGFTAILAAGVGFGIRGGILDNWGREYGFTGEELGRISGGGFTGFCFGIIIGGIIADKIGYGKLVIAAFLLHVVSAVINFGAGGFVAGGPPMAKETIYVYLFWGSFLFAVGNGTLEAVANPLVATLFPTNRTHYLNILHASWPLGLILGGLVSWFLDDKFEWPWKYQLALYLIPTLIYGLMFLGQPMPRSEASEKGLTLGEMFKDVGILGGLIVCGLLALFFSSVVTPLVTSATATPDEAKATADLVRYIGYGFGGVLLLALAVLTRFSVGSFLLFVLFITHGLVGAVELGTDGWIQNITGNLLSSEQGKILFVFTSLVMFSLRFCADFIEKKVGLSPISILLVCAILACAGLLLTSRVNTFVLALCALTVYGVGKTFFWPTMLAVASDRFPRTGAVAISIMGGIGMMSAGLIGSPGLGYAKDRFSGESLREKSPALVSEYQAAKDSEFLIFAGVKGLDGKKLGDIQQKLEAERKKLTPEEALATLTPTERAVFDASIEGDRRTLVADAAIPATMAVIYLLLLIYFKAIGGYKVAHIDEKGGGH